MADERQYAYVQFRRGDQAYWDQFDAEGRVLLLGEPGVLVQDGPDVLKIGDGVSTFANLPVYGGDSDLLTYDADSGSYVVRGSGQNIAVIGNPGDIDVPLSGYWEKTSRTRDATDNRYRLKSQTPANVLDYGADPSGARNSRDAFVAAAATGRVVFIPEGTYLYDGDGMNVGIPAFVGAGSGWVTINLSDGSYFLDSNTAWRSMRVEGITFSGGAGAIRNRWTANNVQGIYIVDACVFKGYSVAAISHNANDMPYWKITRSVFYAANSTSAIGIALPGLTDGCTISDNEFLLNRVHVKLGNGGNNAYLERNDFIQFAAQNGVPRVSLWVVPRAGAPGVNNAGAGLVLSTSKFGNENYDPSDFRVLYADEGAGSLFGDRQPILDQDSTGYIIGHRIEGCLFNGGGGTPNRSLVYSTTPNVLSITVGPIQVGGTSPKHVLEFRTPPTGGNAESVANIVGPLQMGDRNFSPISPTNGAANVAVVDPTGVFEPIANVASSVRVAGDGVGYANLLASPTAWRSEGAAATQVTDALGGTDAVEFNLATGGGYVYLTNALKAGVPVWIEFDLRAGSSTPAAEIAATLGLDVGPLFFRRKIAPTADWTRYRFLAAARTVSSVLFKLQPATGKVQIGRVRIYHAREPMLPALSLPVALTSTTAPSAGGAAAMPATPAGYLTVYIGGTPRQIPYY